MHAIAAKPAIPRPSHLCGTRRAELVPASNVIPLAAVATTPALPLPKILPTQATSARTEVDHLNMSIAPACNQWKLLPVNVLTSAALSKDHPCSLEASSSTKPAVKIFG